MNSQPESEGPKKQGAGDEAMIGPHGVGIYADEPLIAFLQRLSIGYWLVLQEKESL
jgi:hypothetical protein